VDRALSFRKEGRFPSATLMQSAVQEAFHQIQGYRISRGDQMANVIAELKDFLDSQDESPDEDEDEDAPTTVFPRARARRAGTHHAQATTDVHGPIVARAPAVPTALLPGAEDTQPLNDAGRALPAAPSRAATRPAPTLPAHPINQQQVTPHGIVAPSGSATGHAQQGRGARLSPRAAITVVASVAVLVALAIGYVMGTSRPNGASSGESSPTGQPTQSSSSTSGPELVPSSPSSIASGGSGNVPIQQPPASTSSPLPAPSSTTRQGPPAAVTREKDVSSGTLNINSIPVTKVVLDGRPLGDTPRIGVKVSPGPHTVTFIHPTLGRKSVSITVPGGETRTAAVRF
jgi:hypothetical protein